MKQTIIKCPNEQYGYPENYKGRKLSNPDVAHCLITKKWWTTNMIYVGPTPDNLNTNIIEYKDCECINK